MKSLNLIIAREYSSRVKTKAFILTTLLTPILMIASFVIPSILATMKTGDIKTIYVVDKTDTYAPFLKGTEDFSFVVVSDENSKKQGNESGYALLKIDADLSTTPGAVTFYSEKQQPPSHIISYINRTLSDAVKNRRLKEYASENDIAETSSNAILSIINQKNVIDVNTFRLSEGGEAVDTVSHLASIIGMVFTLIMFFFVMMYGSIVMQSVVEEKTNRIVEVIISSVKPFTLMMGKIIAVALMGLTQIAFWIVIMIIAFAAFTFIGSDSFSAGEMEQAIEMAGSNKLLASAIGDQMTALWTINWAQVAISFVFFFVGGYLLYASLFAMFGAAANDAQEAGQFTMPLTMMLIAALYIGIAAARDPESPMAFWASLIPFTSPVVMMVRTPLEVPFWEIALSVILLFATAIGMVFVAGKVYRTGILMYGKKTSFTEIFKWLKYK